MNTREENKQQEFVEIVKEEFNEWADSRAIALLFRDYAEMGYIARAQKDKEKIELLKDHRINNSHWKSVSLRQAEDISGLDLSNRDLIVRNINLEKIECDLRDEIEKLRSENEVLMAVRDRYSEKDRESIEIIQHLKAEQERLVNLCQERYRGEEKRDKLLKQAKPWVDSYHRSRHHTDLNNGQNQARIDWLKELEELNGK